MQKIFKTSLIFGILGGIFFILFLYFAYIITEKSFDANVKSLDFFIYLITLSGALYWFRFKINENKMKFWTGMGVGMITNLVMVLISSFFVYIFLENIAPKQLTKYKEQQLKIIEKIKNSLEVDLSKQKEKTGEKDKEFEKKLREKKEFDIIYEGLSKVTAYDMAWYEWRTKILIGIFMTFIISAVLRK